MEDYLAQGRSAADAAPGHEADVVVVRRLMQFATALVVVIILVSAILRFVMRDFSREERRIESLTPPRFTDDAGQPVAPALQPKPSADLARLREHERDQLSSYGWVDRKAGVAHIPIARAIDIVASSGLPPSSVTETSGREAPGAGQPAAPTKKKPARDNSPEKKP